MHPARRRLVFLSAAIAAVLTVPLPVTVASAATVSAAGTHVGAHHPGMIFTVGASHDVSAGEGRCEPSSRPQFAAGACVALKDAAESCLIGGMSFSADTKVLLASGKAVPISQLHVGDKVLATNTKTGKTQPETVTAVLVHHDTDLFDLKIRDHGKTAVIDTTSNHLFWVLATGGHGGPVGQGHGIGELVLCGRVRRRVCECLI